MSRAMWCKFKVTDKNPVSLICSQSQQRIVCSTYTLELLNHAELWNKKSPVLCSCGYNMSNVELHSADLLRLHSREWADCGLGRYRYDCATTICFGSLIRKKRIATPITCVSTSSHRLTTFKMNNDTFPDKYYYNPHTRTLKK